MFKLIFPTRVDYFDLSKEKELEIARSIISKKESIAEPHLLLQKGLSSYPTDDNILNHIALLPLKVKIQKHLDTVVKDLGFSRPVKITKSWFNVMTAGQQVQQHRHEVSVYSGVLYLEVDNDSAVLQFHSPIEQLRMCEMLSINTQYTEKTHAMPCFNGLLILFPSWLEHSSLMNNSARRVAISFNTFY